MDYLPASRGRSAGYLAICSILHWLGFLSGRQRMPAAVPHERRSVALFSFQLFILALPLSAPVTFIALVFALVALVLAFIGALVGSFVIAFILAAAASGSAVPRIAAAA